MAEIIIDLSDRKATEREISGGKGSSLAYLYRKGLNVPPAVILTTNFTQKVFQAAQMENLIERIRRGDYSASEKAREKLDSINFKTLMGVEWENLLKIIKKWKTIAVRSSILYEDTSAFSMAGQGESVVGVDSKEEEVTAAIKTVLKSFFNQGIIQHMERYGEDTLRGAIILQKFIPGEYSGVIFTRMNGRMIIEYVPGIASPLVQGEVEPGRYEVTHEGKIIQQKIPEKFRVIFYQNGLKKMEVGKKPLPHNIIRELIQTGKKIEEIYSSPRDIEWTYCCNQIYILQARPITHREDFSQYHWSRILGEEFWSGKVSPVMFSLVGKAIEDSMIKKPLKALLGRELSDIPGIALFHDHIYINLDLLKQAFGIIPRWALTEELLSMFPPSMKEEIRKNSSPLPAKLPVAMIRFLMARLPWYFHSNYLIFQKFVEENTLKWLDFSLPTGKNELLESMYKIEEELREFLSIVVWGVTYAYIGVPLTLKIFEKMTGRKFAKSYSHILFSGLKGDINTTFMKEMKKIRENLPEEWEKISTPEELENMKKKYPEFAREWENFIRKYRHRSEERDLLIPRWEEDEILVLKIIKSSSIPPLEERSTGETLRILKQRAKEERVKWRIIYYPPFLLFLWLSRTYLTMRENMRFYADIYLLAFRKILLKIAEKLMEEGVLGDREEIFFLTFDEIKEIIINGNTDPVKQIEERKEKFFQSESPPDYILGGKPFEVPAGNLEHLTGETISPGYARGKVRIIRSLDDFFMVEEGEIIVMSNIDPSWSSLIGKVSGAIFEVGGLLSHGAIIAREFKIPAVAGVKDATKKLKDGEEVILDATAGYITRINSQK